MIRSQPCSNVLQDGASIGSTLLGHCRRNRHAKIVTPISRSAIGIQHANTLGGDPGGHRQSLDQKLMVARFARRRSVSIGEHRHHCRLHDRPVSEVEPRVGTKPRDACVGQRPLRRGQQALDLHFAHGVGLELADAQQVVQGHRQSRSERSFGPP